MSFKSLLITPVKLLLTAFCFLQFALQVLWLGKLRLPRMLRPDACSQAAVTRMLLQVHHHAERFLGRVQSFGLVRFVYQDSPLAEACIVVANHPGLLDFIVILKDLPNAVCLYKSGTLNNPVLSSFVRVAGYIEGMDGTASANKRIIASCNERLQQGRHVVFFPEGTRSETATRMHKFRAAAFQSALKSAAAIQPVAIYCDPLILGKGQSWTVVARQDNVMTIRYLPAVTLAELPADRQTAVALGELVAGRIDAALREMQDQHGP